MIGGNIKELRKQLKLSQEKLATSVGFTRTTVVNWESNYSSPDIPTIRKLKIILNCSYEDLLDTKN